MVPLTKKCISVFQAKKQLGDTEGANTKVGIAAFDTLVWQALASVIIPGKGTRMIDQGPLNIWMEHSPICD